VLPGKFDDGVTGQKCGEVPGDADRPHPRTSASVRNAESLVQIQMTDVGADVGGTAEADHRVHVRAIHVNLATVLVYDRADFGDSLLEHTMCRRIGDHQRGKIGTVSFRFRPQVSDVDVATGVGADHHHFHSRHHRARRIRPVRRLRD